MARLPGGPSSSAPSVRRLGSVFSLQFPARSPTSDSRAFFTLHTENLRFQVSSLSLFRSRSPHFRSVTPRVMPGCGVSPCCSTSQPSSVDPDPPPHQQDRRPTHPGKLAQKPPASRRPCRLTIDIVHRVYDTYDSFTCAPSRGCLV